MSERIAISKIRTDGGTQPRKGLDDATVTQYTESVKAKAKFPPVVVYYDGAAYWLADGFHRLQAHRNAQKRAILADIRQGNLREAILHSAGANATHGLRRSNDDKRRAVMCLLDDPEWSEWSDRAIAKRCNVSHVFVGKLRPDSGNVTTTERKFTHHKTGETSTMNTANIGKQATQLVDNWLRQHFDTEDPANLASHARYSAKHRVYTFALIDNLSLSGVVANETQAQTMLNELALKYQVDAPKVELQASDSPTRKQLLMIGYTTGLISKAQRFTLRDELGKTLLNQANNASSGDYVLIKDLWGALQELLS